METIKKEEIKKEYWKKLKDMYRPEALEWIDKAMFDLDMIDKWSEEEHIRYDILIDLKRDIQKGVK